MAYYSKTELLMMGFSSIGENVRVSDKASIYDCEKIEIADNSRIDDFCVISGKIKIGRNVHITPMCLVAGGTEGIFFEDFTTIAYNVQVFSQSDDYTGETLTNSNIPNQYKNVKREPVFIRKHSIVGAGSTIMPGVTLAEGTSVGAMSLVTKSTDPWGIYFGIPAKRVAERCKKMLELELKYLESLNNE
jgi:acetyltransferase-like isoleucine patch superfamily enzyme